MRFGEIIELRRGDIDLAAELCTSDALRCAPRAATPSHAEKRAGIRDVAIPPHIIPLIEDHLAKYVEPDRDSLLFPAARGGHLQPSTVYAHWYKARPPPAVPICDSTICGTPGRCWPRRPAPP